MGQTVSGWENLSRDERVSQLIDALLLNEMGVVDPLFTARYVELKESITDNADRMRLDLDYWERAAQLRQAGKISSVQELRRQAEELADISSDGELRAAMHELYQRAKERLKG